MRAELGFGFMRLPEVDDKIDHATVDKMVDAFMDAGFAYFDTAYGYHNGLSEDALRVSVVERYPREKFTVATKLPIWAAKTPEDLQTIFDTQLRRTGAGYFDYYMIHAIGSESIAKIDEFGTWEFIRAQKANGLARHIGFSYHDKADLLDKLLTDHPEVEFVQLQLNYADWEDPDVQSRLCYETVIRHGRKVIVMEPVKGGSLALMTDAAKNLLKAARPDASVASWAVRFCGSLPGVIAVLSGMSNMEQAQDNVKTCADFEPLTDADRKTIDAVMDVLNAQPTVPCTGCRYCTEDCPQNINIPGILENYNDVIKYDNLAGARRGYAMFTAPKIKASDCVACGACETRCPQKIGIIDALAKCAELLEV